MDDQGAAEEKKGVSIIIGDDCGNGNDDGDDDDCRNSNFSYFSTDFPRNSYGLAFGLLLILSGMFSLISFKFCVFFLLFVRGVSMAFLSFALNEQLPHILEHVETSKKPRRGECSKQKILFRLLLVVAVGAFIRSLANLIS